MKSFPVYFVSRHLIGNCPVLLGSCLRQLILLWPNLFLFLVFSFLFFLNLQALYWYAACENNQMKENIHWLCSYWTNRLKWSEIAVTQHLCFYIEILVFKMVYDTTILFLFLHLISSNFNRSKSVLFARKEVIAQKIAQKKTKEGLRIWWCV